MEIQPRPELYEPPATVMSFLNEAVQLYPEAISFAPGRPLEEHFGVEEGLEDLGRRMARQARRDGLDRRAAFDRAGQYGATAGAIRDVLAEQLARDEEIRVDPDAVLVTSGCQEAMAIVLAGLFEPSRDTLLVADPTYVGITGLARILGVPVEPVPSSDHGIEPRGVEEAVERVRAAGRRPRGIYVIPDFDNPLGTSLPAPARDALLELAARHAMVVLEDTPYRMFRYEGPQEPALKARDRHGVVIYLGTFSKTLFPGLRVGFLVADQPVRRPTGERAGPLAAELARVKSYTTVNTPALLQELTAAMLERHGGSLVPAVRPKLAAFRLRRDRLLAALDARFRASPDLRAVSWNRPRGGFFLTLSLPFPFDEESFLACAERHRVICCPMSFFSDDPARAHQVRLSFSYVSPEEIDEGVDRLATFCLERLRDRSESRPATAGSTP